MKPTIVTTTELPPSPCPECGDLFECASTPGVAKPKLGDLALCWNCGTILVFDEDLKQVRPKDEVDLLMKMAQHDRHVVLVAQADIKKRGLLRQKVARVMENGSDADE